MKNHIFVLAVLSLAIISTACAPKFYVYERPTIMEEQASGEFPVIEKNMLSKTEAKGPMMTSKNKIAEIIDENQKKKKTYRILNGEFSYEASSK
jgi:hypothetical protein